MEQVALSKTWCQEKDHLNKDVDAYTDLEKYSNVSLIIWGQTTRKFKTLQKN